jgi:hypothetical protein
MIEAVKIDTNCRPRCPQAHVDVRHLLRIPEDYEIKEEPEDELQCLNLDVTVPNEILPGNSLPVLVWIYGRLRYNRDGTTHLLIRVSSQVARKRSLSAPPRRESAVRTSQVL